jgi:hypothetical protein
MDLSAARHHEDAFNRAGASAFAAVSFVGAPLGCGASGHTWCLVALPAELRRYCATHIVVPVNARISRR